MKPIHRKLKDYIHHEEGGSNRCSSTTVLFGSLMSRDCCFGYEDEEGEWHRWFGQGNYRGEKDFLLEYYVVGITADYRIEDDRIVPYLYICLRKGESL